MLIGKKIEEAIRQSGLKPQEVAMYIGVSYARLLSFYRLDSIELKYLRKLAQLLNRPLSFFLSELDPAPQNEYHHKYSATDLHQVKENIKVLHQQLELCHAEMDRLKSELSKTIEKISFVIQENKINSTLLLFSISYIIY